MRVLKSGKEKEWIVTCQNCGADLIYKGEDICQMNKAAEVALMDEYPRKFRPRTVAVCAVECPECGSSVNVPERATNRVAWNESEADF